jgi:hypothetical protein
MDYRKVMNGANLIINAIDDTQREITSRELQHIKEVANNLLNDLVGCNRIKAIAESIDLISDTINYSQGEVMEHIMVQIKDGVKLIREGMLSTQI